jgi:hypothetical protein
VYEPRITRPAKPATETIALIFVYILNFTQLSFLAAATASARRILAVATFGAAQQPMGL